MRVCFRTLAAMLDSPGGDPRAPRRFSLKNKKWKYRGEGNANLVLALTQVGHFHLCCNQTALEVHLS